MRWLLILLVACVVVTALKFALIALLLALVITILWGAYAHPGELFGTLGFFLIANLLMNHTGACLTLVGFIAFWLIFRRPDALVDRPPEQPKHLPSPPDEEQNGSG